MVSNIKPKKRFSEYLHRNYLISDTKPPNNSNKKELDPTVEELWNELRDSVDSLEKIKVYEEIIRKDTSNLDVDRIWMNLYLTLDKVENAKMKLKKIKKLHGDTERFFLASGDYQKHIKEIKKSIDWYQKALEKSPCDKKILIDLGNAYDANSEFEKDFAKLSEGNGY